MQYTNLGLPILPQNEKSTTSGKDFVDAIVGEADTSAFNLLDTLISQLMAAQEQSPSEIFSETQPESMGEGGIWNEIIEITE